MASVSKRNKIFIFIVSTFLFVVVLLAITPFLFQGKIIEAAKKELNKQLNAQVDFKKLSISLLRNFPNASLNIKDLHIIGVDSFSTDTLLYSKDINLVVNLKSLFSDTGYEVKKVTITDSKIFAHILQSGAANWDIMKVDSTETTDTASSNFLLKLKDFVISRADIKYIDETSAMAVSIKNLNHHLTGDLTADSTLLITQTTIDSLDYWSENLKYASGLKVKVDADIKADFNKSIYTLANNSMKINNIPLSVNGWVQMLENGMDMDLKLNTEQVNFKHLLSLIPAIYTNSFENIKAEGNVKLDGFVKGKMIDEMYPAFDLNLNVKDAWFQYPDLPKSVQKINISSRISAPGGDLDATIVDISTFSFDLGGNPFAGNLRVTTPMSDPNFNLKAVGKLNLGMIKEIYPLEKGTDLNGLLDMNVNAAGKMSYIDNNQYDKFTFGGVANAKSMVVKMEDMKQDISIDNANLLFNNRYLNLTNLLLKIGKNDIAANGKVENYLAYALKDKTLSGSFSVNSNYLNLNDFMTTEETSADTSSMELILLPKNLNLGITGNIKKLVYDKMTFANATANMALTDGNLKINNLSTDGFGGKMALSGTYSTSDTSKPGIDMDLNLTNISFAQIFGQVETLAKFAPIFEKAVGTFNSKLQLSTILQNDMMPVLSSVLGNGSLNTQSVSVSGVKALTELASTLKLDKVSNLALKDIALMFDIKDGKLNTKPFNIKAGDIQMNLGGSTGLDQTINYTGTVKLPEKLKAGAFQNIGFAIGGTFTKPTVKLDLQNTIKNLVDENKTNLLNKADEAKEKAVETVNAKKEQAIKEAQEKSDKLLSEAKSAGDKLVQEAQKQADAMVEKATNPVAKALAKKGADELIKQAQKKADKLYSDAQSESNKLVQQASEKTELK
ncbi:MAG: AsmA-like C-terminal region-containing protein [Paludibacteraceae bacterium]